MSRERAEFQPDLQKERRELIFKILFTETFDPALEQINSPVLSSLIDQFLSEKEEKWASLDKEVEWGSPILFSDVSFRLGGFFWGRKKVKAALLNSDEERTVGTIHSHPQEGRFSTADLRQLIGTENFCLAAVVGSDRKLGIALRIKEHDAFALHPAWDYYFDEIYEKVIQETREKISFPYFSLYLLGVPFRRIGKATTTELTCLRNEMLSYGKILKIAQDFGLAIYEGKVESSIFSKIHLPQVDIED